MGYCWNDTDGENRSNQRKTCPSATFPPTYPAPKVSYETHSKYNISSLKVAQRLGVTVQTEFIFVRQQLHVKILFELQV
jgi:hypothetical protein